MLLLWFIVWPLSWLVEFVLDHVSELPEYLVLPLHPLLLAEHGQGALFIRRVNLVFFPQPESNVSLGTRDDSAAKQGDQKSSLCNDFTKIFMW